MYPIHRTMIVAGAMVTLSPSEMVFITQAVSRPTNQQNRTAELRDYYDVSQTALYPSQRYILIGLRSYRYLRDMISNPMYLVT